MFINSPLEKFNLSLLPEGGRGSVNNFLCPYSSCPIYAKEGEGKMRMDQCLLLSNFFLEDIPKCGKRIGSILMVYRFDRFYRFSRFDRFCC